MQWESRTLKMRMFPLISFRSCATSRLCLQLLLCVTTRVNPSDVTAWKTKENFADKVLKKSKQPKKTINLLLNISFYCSLFVLMPFGCSEVNYWWISTRLYFFNGVGIKWWHYLDGHCSFPINLTNPSSNTFQLTRIQRARIFLPNWGFSPLWRFLL